jgi:hypothetical protein
MRKPFLAVKVVLFNSLTKKGILMTLKSTRDMIEKVKENEMTSVDSVDYLRGLKDEDSVLISPRNFLPNTGGGCTEADLSNGKWYRIAIGYPGNAVSSGLFNIGNLFVNEPPRAILFYAFTEGYNNGTFITKIAASNSLPISKARLLHARSTTERSYLDVYIQTSGINTYKISAATLINFKLQTPEEVSEDIPKGYAVDEVSF